MNKINTIALQEKCTWMKNWEKKCSDVPSFHISNVSSSLFSHLRMFPATRLLVFWMFPASKFQSFCNVASFRIWRIRMFPPSVFCVLECLQFPDLRELQCFQLLDFTTSNVSFYKRGFFRQNDVYIWWVRMICITLLLLYIDYNYYNTLYNYIWEETLKMIGFFKYKFLGSVLFWWTN